MEDFPRKGHCCREPMYEAEAPTSRDVQTLWGEGRETLSSQFKLKKKKKGNT